MTRNPEFICISDPSPELARRGIDCLLAGPERGGITRKLDIRARRSGFDLLCQQHNISIHNQVLCLENGALAVVCLWVPNPGKSAVCYLPPTRFLQDKEPQTAACLQMAVGAAAAAGMKMIQGVFDVDEAILQRIYRTAGYDQLAVLQFMEHSPRWAIPDMNLPAGYHLETYRSSTHELFKEAIGASYEQTLDCPKMSGLRSLDDVIIGHQHVGAFDPELWFVLVHESRGIGVLLLTLNPALKSLDVTYLGLALSCRRLRLGLFFMSQIKKMMQYTGTTTSLLAVDEANTPALTLYRKAGYRPTQRREVYFVPLATRARENPHG